MSNAVVYWVDVFARSIYKEIVIDSLKHCIQKKGLVPYAYVIMRKHIHWIISKQQDTPAFSEIMRDFKKFASMNMLTLQQNLSVHV